jgi:hypothetical protein
MGGARTVQNWDTNCIIYQKVWNKARGKTRHEWEGDIKMVLKEVGC